MKGKNFYIFVIAILLNATLNILGMAPNDGNSQQALTNTVLIKSERRNQAQRIADAAIHTIKTEDDAHYYFNIQKFQEFMNAHRAQLLNKSIYAATCLCTKIILKQNSLCANTQTWDTICYSRLQEVYFLNREVTAELIIRNRLNPRSVPLRHLEQSMHFTRDLCAILYGNHSSDYHRAMAFAAARWEKADE